MFYQLLIDFGLVILIWMTQLVVYPSFTYFSSEDLFRWHEKYTTAISVIVMPLMMGQLGLHSYYLSQQFTWLKTAAFILILLAWVNTFFYAVPLHNKIGAKREILESAHGLVAINWYRTILWTMVFAISIFEYFQIK